ncbi:MAG: biliverdin-producing heme oxygenase [Cyanobacteria bacterium P01_F01_bin.150]
MNHTLAMRLRTGTQDSHTLAENTAFMKLFLKGIIIKEAFRRFLANLYFVYVALESEMRHYQDNPVVGLMYFPQVERVAALEQDLAFYYGDDWRERVTPEMRSTPYRLTKNRLLRL